MNGNKSGQNEREKSRSLPPPLKKAAYILRKTESVDEQRERAVFIKANFQNKLELSRDAGNGSLSLLQNISTASRSAFFLLSPTLIELHPTTTPPLRAKGGAPLL